MLYARCASQFVGDFGNDFSDTLWCADKLILETILQDKFSYFKAEEGGVAVATATDDNAEIRNLDARLFEKSTCRYTSPKSFIIL